MQYTRLATKVLFPHEQALSTMTKTNQNIDHPEETSKNSDICDFSKVSDIGNEWWTMRNLYFKPFLLVHFLEIYIWKNMIKYGHPNYVETFMDSIRMTQIFMDFYQFITLLFT